MPIVARRSSSASPINTRRVTTTVSRLRREIRRLANSICSESPENCSSGRGLAPNATRADCCRNCAKAKEVMSMVIAVAMRTGRNASRSMSSETTTTARMVPRMSTHHGWLRSRIMEKPPIMTSCPYAKFIRPMTLKTRARPRVIRE